MEKGEIYEDIYSKSRVKPQYYSKKFNSEKTMSLLDYNSVGYTVQDHWHDWLEFIYVEEGEMILNLDNEQYILSKNCLAFIPYCMMHATKTQGICHKITFQISGIYMSEKYPRYDVGMIECVVHKNDPRINSNAYIELKNLYRNVIKYFDPSSEVEEMLFQGYLNIFLSQLYTQFSLKEKVKHENRLNGYLSSVGIYIHQHYKEDLSVSGISEMFNISQQHLNRIFKQVIGMTVREYILQLRLSHATYEIIKSNKALIDVCYDCGFANKQSFNRDFKRKYGIVPSEYRSISKK